MLVDQSGFLFLTWVEDERTIPVAIVAAAVVMVWPAPEQAEDPKLQKIISNGGRTYVVAAGGQMVVQESMDEILLAVADRSQHDVSEQMSRLTDVMRRAMRED